MIKDIMVHLDGSADDDLRLSAAASLAHVFDSHIIGLFLNVIPPFFPDQGEVTAELVDFTREGGADTEAALAAKLAGLGRPAEIRRFDVFSDEIAATATRNARSADVFLTSRPFRTQDAEDVVTDVLYGSGRHIVLVPESGWPANALDHAVIGWNGDREASRAVGEALPYLRKAREVTILVVEEGAEVEEEATLGGRLKEHLRHHGVNAILHHARKQAEVGETLIGEAKDRKAGLLVLGGYSHSHFRESLFGGVTRHLLRYSPLPLLLAH
jgi:nucleotide-binding universal stress UspA family protein